MTHRPRHARLSQTLATLILLSLTLILQACGGSGSSAPNYTISASISGLTGSLTLQNNGSDTLTLSQNGDYTFTTRLNEGTGYNITIQTPAENDTCTLTNSSGTVAKQNINISINCVPTTYTLGGSISGLSDSLTLQNNGSDTLTLTQNGNYTFTTPQINASHYAITISQQPNGQHCTLTNSSGTVAKQNINTIQINCIPIYTLSVTVNGLQSATVTLKNNSETYAISASGSHTFPTALPEGSDYTITIQSQPNGYQCNFDSNNTSGTIANQNINNITLNCNAAPNGYYTGSASVKSDNNTTPLDITDLQAMINGNRMMFMSDTQHLLYDATITSITGTHYSADVNIYKLGQVYTTATLTGTIQGSTIQGTVDDKAGTQAGNGTFTLMRQGQANSQQADLTRLVTDYDFDSDRGNIWQASMFGLGEAWGFSMDVNQLVTGENNGNVIGIGTATDGIVFGCNYFDSELLAVPSSSLYQANIVLNNCRSPFYTEVVSGNYTGLAMQYSVVGSDDTVLLAYTGTGAEVGVFAIYKIVRRGRN